MKVNRNGKAASLSDSQLDLLIENAPSPKYRALWTLQRYTASRISEALSLTWGDIAHGTVTFRRATTKTRVTRQVPQVPPLRAALESFRTEWRDEWGWEPNPTECVFTGPYSTLQPLTSRAADYALRATCKKLGIYGASTHSFRRSLAQRCVAQGVPLKVVQQITGHRSLGSLGEYLDATPEQIASAIYS